MNSTFELVPVQGELILIIRADPPSANEWTFFVQINKPVRSFWGSGLLELLAYPNPARKGKKTKDNIRGIVYLILILDIPVPFRVVESFYLSLPSTTLDIWISGIPRDCLCNL